VKIVPRWMRAIFVANLVAQTAIIVTGAVVRLTGSGLGCPTWPECAAGSYVPTARQEESWHKYVEFGNRTLTFAVGAIAIATLIAAVIYSPSADPGQDHPLATQFCCSVLPLSPEP